MYCPLGSMIWYHYVTHLAPSYSVGDDFEEVEEDENLDDLQEGEVSAMKGMNVVF